MHWVVLFLAGLFEIAWAIGLKYSDGFTRFWPSLGTLLSLLISFVLLGFAMKNLPAGTAYAVWVGIGAIGAVAAGIVLFGESADPLRLLSVALIGLGVVGLKLAQG